MQLIGIFQCVRCHATHTELTIVKGEGTVCEDVATCQQIRELESSADEPAT